VFLKYVTEVEPYGCFDAKKKDPETNEARRDLTVIRVISKVPMREGKDATTQANEMSIKSKQ
jgi:hypothetical protein